MRIKGALLGFLATGFLLLSFAPAGAATVYDIDLTTQASFGNLNQHDTGCGDFACGPTAAVNSFVFLQNKYPTIYDHSLVPDTNMNGMTDYAEMVAAANALSDPAYMDCAACHGGTLLTDFISGKMKWINERAPGTTVFMSQSNVGWPFLYNELNDMEDVELLVGFYNSAGERVGGHYITLSSFHWVDQNMDDIINSDETATIDFVDPDTGLVTVSQLRQGTSGLTTPYGTGPGVATTLLETAISESPVPEPATIALLAICSVAVGGYRRKRRAA